MNLGQTSSTSNCSLGLTTARRKSRSKRPKYFIRPVARRRRSAHRRKVLTLAGPDEPDPDLANPFKGNS